LENKVTVPGQSTQLAIQFIIYMLALPSDLLLPLCKFPRTKNI